MIVFTRLAGGARARLLALTPVLMLLQMLLLPAYMFLFAGADTLASIDMRPFVSAFLFLIVAPLLAAGALQLSAPRRRFGGVIDRAADAAMVPLMMLTLAIVVASQVAAVGTQAAELSCSRVPPETRSSYFRSL